MQADCVPDEQHALPAAQLVAAAHGAAGFAGGVGRPEAQRGPRAACVDRAGAPGPHPLWRVRGESRCSPPLRRICLAPLSREVRLVKSRTPFDPPPPGASTQRTLPHLPLLAEKAQHRLTRGGEDGSAGCGGLASLSLPVLHIT